MTANPNAAWVAQQARNLLLVLEERGRRLCYVLHDRDAKFTRGFDDVFASHGAEVLLTRDLHLTQAAGIRRTGSAGQLA